MNPKIIHSVILMLLLCLTAHEVHASVNHDPQTCDVCIHIQSNDDALADNSPQDSLLDSAFHLKIKAQQNAFKLIYQPNAGYIRGPPTFS